MKFDQIVWTSMGGSPTIDTPSTLLDWALGKTLLSSNLGLALLGGWAPRTR